MARELVFKNGKIVLVDRVVDGNIVVRDTLITEVDDTSTEIKTSIDLEGDYLLPGLIELHTDNLEKHVNPRPGVRWPTAAALLAHDSQVIAAGITSVFDALSVGDIRDDSARLQDLDEMVSVLNDAHHKNSLRANHYLHLRCEVSCQKLTEMFMPLAKKTMVHLISMMDHTPGQRQFIDPEQYKSYYSYKWGKSSSEIDAFIHNQTAQGTHHSDSNRTFLSEYCRNREIPLASHDDATLEHIEDAVRLGAKIAEFPTTLDAARAARKSGLEVMVGTPNLVCGGSHSGNVSAARLAAEGLITVLSSDYVPLSLLHGVFLLTSARVGITLPRAVAYASAVPARTVGIKDRGEIAPERVADLVRVHILNDLPIVSGVWRNGERVA